MKRLETERLTLRPLAPADAEDLYRIYADAETMTFVGRGPASVEDERAAIRAHAEKYYDVYGYGLWGVVLKGGGGLVGRCGLLNQEAEGRSELEVTYLLERGHWGKGLATEAARAVLKHAREDLGRARVVAFIDPRNTASVRVAEKAGLAYERAVVFKSYGLVSLYSVEYSRA